MIPTTGWLDALDNQGADVLHHPLPVPYIAIYRDGAPGTVSVAAPAPTVTQVVGGADASAEAGLNVQSRMLVIVTLRQTNVFGVVMLDTLTVPPPWSRCDDGHDTSWTACSDDVGVIL